MYSRQICCPHALLVSLHFLTFFSQKSRQKSSYFAQNPMPELFCERENTSETRREYHRLTVFGFRAIVFGLHSVISALIQPCLHLPRRGKFLSNVSGGTTCASISTRTIYLWQKRWIHGPQKLQRVRFNNKSIRVHTIYGGNRLNSCPKVLKRGIV